jgi:hypothetical protein
MRALVLAWWLSVTGCGVAPLALTAGSGGTARPKDGSPFAESAGLLGSRTGASGLIAGVCPNPEMSCYPGCAMAGDTLACGKALVLIAGSLAASMIYLAAEEAIPLQDFCGRYGALREGETEGGATAVPGQHAVHLPGSWRFVHVGEGADLQIQLQG